MVLGILNLLKDSPRRTHPLRPTCHTFLRPLSHHSSFTLLPSHRRHGYHIFLFLLYLFPVVSSSSSPFHASFRCVVSEQGRKRVVASHRAISHSALGMFLLFLINLTSQRECFSNLLGIFHISIWVRGGRKSLQRGGSFKIKHGDWMNHLFSKFIKAEQFDMLLLADVTWC